MKKQLMRLALLTPFAILSLFALFNHEPWRDETHNILYPTRIEKITNVIRILQMPTEPTPPLWPLIIWSTSSFSKYFIGAALIHWAMILAALWLMMRYAPFTWYEKVLISLGYFMVYDYSIIVRNYGVGVLLVFAVLSIYPKRFEYFWGFCLLLSLLAISNLLGLMLSFFILVLTLWNAPPETRRSPWWLLPIVFVLISTLFIISPKGFANAEVRESIYGIIWPSPIKAYYLIKGIIVQVCLSVPSSRFIGFPHTSSAYPGYSLLMALVFTALIFICAPRHRTACLYFWVSTLGFMAVYLLRGFGLRHHGYLFINLIVSLWLDGIYKNERLMFSIPWVHDQRVVRIALALLLLAQVWSGVNAVLIEYRFPFSAAKAAGENLSRILTGKKPDQVLLATFQTTYTEGMLAFMDDRYEFYSLEVMKPYRHFRTDREWFRNDPLVRRYTLQELVERFISLLQTGRYQDAYLITAGVPFDVRFQNGFYLKPVYVTPRIPAITADESQFIIYQMTKD